MHMREAIRNAIKSVLDTNLITVPPGNVFKGRVYPMDDASLPGVCIYVEEESSLLGTTMGFPRTSERILTINIDIYVKGEDDITDSLGFIAADIEMAMTQDVTLKDLALDLQVTGWNESLNAEQQDKSQGKKTGVGEMTYEILYDVPETKPNYTP